MRAALGEDEDMRRRWAAAAHHRGSSPAPRAPRAAASAPEPADLPPPIATADELERARRLHFTERDLRRILAEGTFRSVAEFLRYAEMPTRQPEATRPAPAPTAAARHGISQREINQALASGYFESAEQYVALATADLNADLSLDDPAPPTAAQLRAEGEEMVRLGLINSAQEYQRLVDGTAEREQAERDAHGGFTRAQLDALDALGPSPTPGQARAALGLAEPQPMRNAEGLVYSSAQGRWVRPSHYDQAQGRWVED